MEVIRLVQDDESPSGTAAGERATLGGFAGDALDHVRPAAVAGVEFHHGPAHVVGQRVGGGGLPDAGAAVDDHRVSVLVPSVGPLLQFISGLVVPAYLRQRRRPVLLGPVTHF